MSIHWSSYLLFREKKKEIRYFSDTETQEFFETLLTTAKERIESINKGQRYWRAQLGYDDSPCYDHIVPHSHNRMKPESEKAFEGRINPKGIPCLYLATDEKTAVSEVRPWAGSYVTVAQLETIKDLKVIDCSRGEINPMNVTVSDLDKLWKLEQPTPEETMKTIWRWVDKDFSEPVDHNDNTAGYVTTQIIAELFKTNGFDGIKYKSLFNNGKNLALFDINAAKQIDDGKVFQVTKVDVVGYEQILPFQSNRSKI